MKSEINQSADGPKNSLCCCCDKLRGELAKVEGRCLTCGELFDFDDDEPFAYCKCGTSEWGDPRPDRWHKHILEEKCKALKTILLGYGKQRQFAGSLCWCRGDGRAFCTSQPECRAVQEALLGIE